MSDPAPRSHRSTAEPGVFDLADRYWRLWQGGPPPDLAVFVARFAAIAPEQLSAILRVEQQERWRIGEEIAAEALLDRYPLVAGDAEACVDLIYGEYLLRERVGRRQPLEEFVGRFPKFAATLREQIELHGAIEAAGPSSSLESGEQLHSSAGAAATQGHADAPLPDLPENFGRYRILKRIGHGGMGAVYLAHDRQLDRRVALKTPRLDPLRGESTSRFHREARIAGALAHPNLCPVFDVGEHNGIHYLTMPFIEGESLKECLTRDSSPSATDAARLCAQIAQALAVVHEAGVLHRDLKPANIMIDVRGEPIVMDFGLARRSTTGDGGETVSGILLGTPLYSAPEQIGVAPDSLGPACDVYALGAILYEMLAGRPPFVGPVHEVLRQVLASEPEPIASFRPDIDPRLEAICLKALAKAPYDRFASMADFAEALENFDRQPRHVRLGWLARRRMAAAAAILVSAVAGGVAWKLMAPTNRPAASPPEDGFAAGDHWQGTFHFLPPLDPAEGQAALSIAKRDEAAFTGEYSTENGAYRWKVTGEIRNGRASITLGEFMGEENPVSGVATIEGTVEDDQFQATFRDGNSAAQLLLQRERDAMPPD